MWAEFTPFSCALSVQGCVFLPPPPPPPSPLLYHLVRGVAGVSPPTDQGQQVTAEQHLHDANASVAENPAERLSERVHVVDAEPVIRAAGKASCFYFVEVFGFRCLFFRRSNENGDTKRNERAT